MQANSNILSNRLSDPTDDQAAVRLSRRAAVRALMAAAASALARPHVAGAQSAAPAGEPSPIGDLGMELSIDQRSAGITLLKHYASIDTHCHPGRFFLGQLPYATPMTRAFGEPFVEQAIADLSSANVSAALFAAVADMRLLEMTPTGIRANGAFQAGEAYADYKRQINQLQALIAQHKLARGLTPANVFSAHQHRQTALIFAVEGGDFIEDRLDRLHQAFLDGVRAITIVHYHINQIGDIQTEAPVHGGLTVLGKSIVREMNRNGIIIDLAHATFAVTKDVVNVTTKPVMISHSNLVTRAFQHPRLISKEHAKLVADVGGIIGAWPAGMGQVTFADYIDSIQRLVDAVGIAHVAVGTDMDANFRPVLRSYRDWALVPAALLARGLSEGEVASVMGGNFLRVFKESQAGA